MSGPVHRAAMRRRTTPIAAGLAIASIAASLLLGTASPAPVEAQSDDADPVVIPTIERGLLHLELVEQSFDIEPGDDIELTYLVTGDLEAADLLPSPTTTTTTTTTSPSDESDQTDDAEAPAPPLVPLSVAVTNYEPIDDDVFVDRAIGPDVRIPLLPPNIDGVLIEDARPLIEVGDDGAAVLTLSIPTDVDPSEPGRLRFDANGLHPLVVEVKIADIVIANHGTVIDRRDDDLALPPVDLSLLTFLPDPGPSGTLAEVDASITAIDSTADVATDLDAPLTMSIPPNIARLAVEASTSNDLPAAFADDELMATPATPFDVSSATAIGRIDAFVDQLTFGEDVLRQAFPATAVRRDAWLVTSPISTEAARELRDRAVRFMVMPQQLYLDTVDDELPATDRFVEVDLGNGSTMPILVIDDLGNDLTREATDDILDDLGPYEWSVAAVVAMRFDQYDAPPAERDDHRSRILATPKLTPPDTRLLAALERFAATTDALRFSAASDLSGVTAVQRTDAPITLPDAAGPSLDARLALITSTQEALISIASMLPPEDERLATWNRQLSGFVSTAYGDDAVIEAVETIMTEASRITDAVIPPDPISFTLTGNDGEIDLQIGNRLDEPITVVLRLTSPRLTFPDGDRLLTLPANSSQTVAVPVRARANGTSSVNVEILTPDLRLSLIEPVTLKSRVNALTGLGQVLTAGLLLVLATWWFGHWRKKRRAAGPEADETLGTDVVDATD